MSTITFTRSFSKSLNSTMTHLLWCWFSWRHLWVDYGHSSRKPSWIGSRLHFSHFSGYELSGVKGFRSKNHSSLNQPHAYCCYCYCLHQIFSSFYPVSVAGDPTIVFACSCVVKSEYWSIFVECMALFEDCDHRYPACGFAVSLCVRF